jgi:hypothetical protein
MVVYRSGYSCPIDEDGLQGAGTCSKLQRSGAGAVFEAVGPVRLPDEENEALGRQITAMGYRIRPQYPLVRALSWPWSLPQRSDRGPAVPTFALGERVFLVAERLRKRHGTSLEVVSDGGAREQLDGLETTTTACVEFVPPGAAAFTARATPQGGQYQFQCQPLPSVEDLRASLAGLPCLVVKVDEKRARAYSDEAWLTLSPSALAPSVGVEVDAGVIDPEALGDALIRISAAFPDNRYAPGSELGLREAGPKVARFLAEGASRVTLDAGALGRVVIERGAPARRAKARLTYWRRVMATLAQDSAMDLDEPQDDGLWSNFRSGNKPLKRRESV